ncbi:MAG TPA: sigma-70 family RNA polymerase sigma factor [Pirellulaceae bacterium]|nr:sigma-70 family RNA polymerase sigma factor [Pirellulaceae bacterium]
MTFQDDKLIVTALVRRAQVGDRDALGQLFERFERHLFLIARRRLGNDAEAQELVQDVFVQVIEKLAQLREPECFAGWLRTITHRTAINRGMRRGPEVSAEPETLEATCETDERCPLADAIRREEGAELRAGLGRLGRLDRETLEAFYVRGQTLIEMSDAFEAPVGTIKRRLHVARKRLAKEVEPLVAV